VDCHLILHEQKNRNSFCKNTDDKLSNIVLRYCMTDAISSWVVDARGRAEATAARWLTTKRLKLLSMEKYDISTDVQYIQHSVRYHCHKMVQKLTHSTPDRMRR